MEETDREDVQFVPGRSRCQHVIDDIAHIDASGVGNADLLDDPQERIGMGLGIFHPPSGSTKYSGLFLMTFVEGNHTIKVWEEAKPL